jgi:hypothetical protein
VSESLKRVLAQALLPASILPVLLLGPGLVRAPQTLWRRVSAEVRRLDAPGGASGRHQSRRVTATRGQRGVPGTRARGEVRLFPGARYAPLHAVRPGARPAARPTYHAVAGAARR